MSHRFTNKCYRVPRAAVKSQPAQPTSPVRRHPCHAERQRAGARFRRQHGAANLLASRVISKRRLAHLRGPATALRRRANACRTRCPRATPPPGGGGLAEATADTPEPGQRAPVIRPSPGRALRRQRACVWRSPPDATSNHADKANPRVTCAAAPISDAPAVCDR
jgi:hypothetical protein